VRRLGVGLIYLRELDPLFREGNPDLAVLELEPEMFWEKLYPEGDRRAPRYLPNSEAMARIAALPQQKLVHSVGFPVGGSAQYDGDYVTPLVAAVRDLDAVWASAHLSFNTVSLPEGPEQVGFLLPPRQTPHGVDLAVANIAALRKGLTVPLAFETGVNYLRPRADELSDGEFFGAIAERADCGILLDLHNLWANERNGRQPVKDVLNELPLDRVWEIHLAGGMMLDGYYLDAHSGPIPSEVLDLAADVVPNMPNLGAMNFEIMSGHVSTIGLDGIRQQLARINEVWRLPRVVRVVPRPATSVSSSGWAAGPDVATWEQTLAALAVGQGEPDSAHGDLGLADLAFDPAIPLFRRLVEEGRSGQLSRALHYTTIVMLASWGSDAVHSLLDDYCAEVYPDAFAAGEADRFVRFLRGRLDRMPPARFLTPVLSFEHALVRASLFGESSTVRWSIDPSELFESLDRGVLPTSVTERDFHMEIRPAS
jgi:uncharacterized protein (UPF0276 family)